MSLFQCVECGCCENTACCNYHVRRAYGQPIVCSACDPDIREWHGKFARVFLPLGEFKTNRVGNLEHIATGSEDFRSFAIVRAAAALAGDREQSSA